MLEKKKLSLESGGVESRYHSIITLLGEDAGREGLLKTPNVLRRLC